MFLSIIIPLYNEEREIINTLNEVSSLNFPDFVENIEIVVIDDGSIDNSYDLVNAYCEKNDLVRLLRHDKNKGKGAAIRSGLMESKGSHIVLQDADMELRPQDIIGMLKAMDNLKVSFVNGSRYLAGINRPLFKFWRYKANQFFTLLTSVVINVHLTDVACGYKLFKREMLEGINLRENRFGFETELMIKAIRYNNYRQIAEVPVYYSPRNIQEGKKIRNVDGLKILWVILKYGFFRYS